MCDIPHNNNRQQNCDHIHIAFQEFLPLGPTRRHFFLAACKNQIIFKHLSFYCVTKQTLLLLYQQCNGINYRLAIHCWKKKSSNELRMHSLGVIAPLSVTNQLKTAYTQLHDMETTNNLCLLNTLQIKCLPENQPIFFSRQT